MQPKRIQAIFLRQLYLLTNNPTRLAGNFVWLTISIVQWGFITKYLATLGKANFNFITVILGALILWEFVTRIQQGMMMAFLEDIWSNNLLNFFASPLKISEYAVGLLASSILTALVGLFAMALIAGLCFGYDIFVMGLLMIPSVIVLFLFGMALGLFTCSMIFRLGPSAEWLSWPLPMILSLISGVYYPIDTLPPVMATVARCFPPAFVFESLRSLIEQTQSLAQIWQDQFLGLCLALGYLLITYFFFRRVYHHNRDTGRLARFNASI